MNFKRKKLFFTFINPEKFDFFLFAQQWYNEESFAFKSKDLINFQISIIERHSLKSNIFKENPINPYNFTAIFSQPCGLSQNPSIFHSFSFNNVPIETIKKYIKIQILIKIQHYLNRKLDSLEKAAITPYG